MSDVVAEGGTITATDRTLQNCSAFANEMGRSF